MNSISPTEKGTAILEKLQKEFKDEQRVASLGKEAHDRFFSKVFASKLIAWMNYGMITVDKYAKLTEDEMERRSFMTAPFTRILCKGLYEKIFGFKQRPDVKFKYETEDKDNTINKYIDYIIENIGLVDSYSNIIENFIQHGSGFHRISFTDTYRGVDRYKNHKKKKKIKYDNLQMFGDVISIYHFTYDQRKSDIYKSNFFHYFNYEPIDDFLKRWAFWLDKKQIENIKEFSKGRGGSMNGFCDYDRHKEIEAMDQYMVMSLSSMTKSQSNLLYKAVKVDAMKQIPIIENYLSDILEADNLVEELYLDDRIILSVSGQVVATIDNFFSEQSNGHITHPYVQFNIGASPSKTLNASIPEVLAPLQKMYDRIMNGFSDQMTKQLHPMYTATGMVQFSDDGVMKDNKVVYKKDHVVQSFGEGRLEIMKFSDINSGILTILDYIFNLGQIQSSLNKYTMGGIAGVERSAEAAQYLADVTNDAVRPTHASLAIGSNRIFKIAMILTKEQIGDKLVMGNDQVVDLSFIEKIENFNMDIAFTSESVSDLFDFKYIQNVNKILNTLRPELMQFESLNGVPFLNTRKIYRELFEKIGENGFIYSDEEIEELMEQMMAQQQQQAQMPGGGELTAEEAANVIQQGQGQIFSDNLATPQDISTNEVEQIDFNNLPTI